MKIRILLATTVRSSPPRRLQPRPRNPRRARGRHPGSGRPRPHPLRSTAPSPLRTKSNLMARKLTRSLPPPPPLPRVAVRSSGRTATRTRSYSRATDGPDNAGRIDKSGRPVTFYPSSRSLEAARRRHPPLWSRVRRRITTRLRIFTSGPAPDNQPASHLLSPTRSRARNPPRGQDRVRAGGFSFASSPGRSIKPSDR